MLSLCRVRMTLSRAVVAALVKEPHYRTEDDLALIKASLCHPFISLLS